MPFATITKLRLNSKWINIAWYALVVQPLLVCAMVLFWKIKKNVVGIKRADKTCRFIIPIYRIFISGNQYPTIRVDRLLFFFSLVTWCCYSVDVVVSFSPLIFCIACLYSRRVASCVSTKRILITLFYAYKFKQLEWNRWKKDCTSFQKTLIQHRR